MALLNPKIVSAVTLSRIDWEQFGSSLGMLSENSAIIKVVFVYRTIQEIDTFLQNDDLFIKSSYDIFGPYKTTTIYVATSNQVDQGFSLSKSFERDLYASIAMEYENWIRDYNTKNHSQQTFRIFEETPGIVIYELVQNAVDADAKEVRFQFGNNPGRIDTFPFMFIHNGRPFTPLDVHSLTFFSSSGKTGNLIGNKGIGFKSIFAVTDKVCIKNGNWQFTYHKKKQIGGKLHIDFGFSELKTFDPKTYISFCVQDQTNFSTLLKQINQLVQSRTLIILSSQNKTLHSVYINETQFSATVKVPKQVIHQSPESILSSTHWSYNGSEYITLDRHRVNQSQNVCICFEMNLSTVQGKHFRHCFFPLEDEIPYNCFDVHANFQTNENRTRYYKTKAKAITAEVNELIVDLMKELERTDPQLLAKVHWYLFKDASFTEDYSNRKIFFCDVSWKLFTPTETFVQLYPNKIEPSKANFPAILLQNWDSDLHQTINYAFETLKVKRAINLTADVTNICRQLWPSIGQPLQWHQVCHERVPKQYIEFCNNPLKSSNLVVRSLSLSFQALSELKEMKGDQRRMHLFCEILSHLSQELLYETCTYQKHGQKKINATTKFRAYLFEQLATMSFAWVSYRNGTFHTIATPMIGKIHPLERTYLNCYVEDLNEKLASLVGMQSTELKGVLFRIKELRDYARNKHNPELESVYDDVLLPALHKCMQQADVSTLQYTRQHFESNPLIATNTKISSRKWKWYTSKQVYWRAFVDFTDPRSLEPFKESSLASLFTNLGVPNEILLNDMQNHAKFSLDIASLFYRRLASMKSPLIAGSLRIVDQDEKVVVIPTNSRFVIHSHESIIIHPPQFSTSQAIFVHPQVAKMKFASHEVMISFWKWIENSISIKPQPNIFYSPAISTNEAEPDDLRNSSSTSTLPHNADSTIRSCSSTTSSSLGRIPTNSIMSAAPVNGDRTSEQVVNSINLKDSPSTITPFQYTLSNIPLQKSKHEIGNRPVPAVKSSPPPSPFSSNVPSSSINPFKIQPGTPPPPIIPFKAQSLLFSASPSKAPSGSSFHPQHLQPATPETPSKKHSPPPTPNSKDDIPFIGGHIPTALEMEITKERSLVAESCAFLFELQRFSQNLDLRDKIVWVNQKKESMLCYDIYSFENVQGKWKGCYVEVKSSVNKDFAFQMSATEYKAFCNPEILYKIYFYGEFARTEATSLAPTKIWTNWEHQNAFDFKPKGYVVKLKKSEYSSTGTEIAGWRP